MSARENTSTEACLALPFDGRWELWAFPHGRPPRLRIADGDPAAFPLTSNATIALPAGALTCLPLWILTPNADLIPEMLRLQLEQRGLLHGDESDPAHAWRVVPQDKLPDRTLALTVLVRPDIPPALSRADFHRFEAAPRCLDLPPSQYTLWRELDRLVLALTRGRELAYFQPLCAAEPGPDLCSELHCTHFALAAQKIAPENPSLTLWAGLDPQALELLQNQLGWPIAIARRPPPRLPSPPWDLKPPAVRAEQTRRQQSRQITRIASIIAAAYLLGLGAFAAHLHLLQRSVRATTAQLAADRPAVERIRDAASRWNAMELALNPALAPMEILLQATEVMAPEGVRMTHFQIDGYKLRIEGEARPPTAFVAYREQIENAAFFAGFHWERAEPVIEANNIAKFTIQGTHPYAPTDKK